MSSQSKRPYSLMARVAAQMAEKLGPSCTRLEIAGSLRRHVELIGDIEIVAVPKPVVDLFGEPTGKTEVDVLLSKWPVKLLADGQHQKKFTALIYFIHPTIKTG